MYIQVTCVQGRLTFGQSNWKPLEEYVSNYSLMWLEQEQRSQLNIKSEGQSVLKTAHQQLDKHSHDQYINGSIQCTINLILYVFSLYLFCFSDFKTPTNPSSVHTSRRTPSGPLLLTYRVQQSWSCQRTCGLRFTPSSPNLVKIRMLGRYEIIFYLYHVIQPHIKP